MKNIILTGIMGCGKTTLGRAAAVAMNMDFIDMDEFIELRAGMTVSEIFAKYGEEGFRDMESDACREIAKMENTLAAAGGGVVLRKENTDCLRKTGVNIFINRPVDNIISDVDTSGRPLLKDGAGKIRELFNKRRELYYGAADAVLDNSGGKDEALSRLTEIIRRLRAPKLAVIGDPIGHSLSPDIHLPVLKKYCESPAYEKVQVKKGRLPQWLRRVKDEGFDGFNLTMPHKIDIIPFLDGIDREAEISGSVNTVVNLGGKLYGHTTDAEGFFAALNDLGVSHKGKRLLILGAGGAARAIIFRAALDGAEITVLSRREEQAQELKKLVESRVPGAKILSGRMTTAATSRFSSGADVLINATPCGMEGSGGKWEDLSFLKSLPDSAAVCDLIYKPEKTELLEEAEASGRRIMNGLGMLIYQAIIADEHYLGVKIDKRAAAELARANLRRN